MHSRRAVLVAVGLHDGDGDGGGRNHNVTNAARRLDMPLGSPQANNPGS